MQETFAACWLGDSLMWHYDVDVVLFQYSAEVQISAVKQLELTFGTEFSAEGRIERTTLHRRA